MVGFYFGDPTDSRDLRDAGLDVVPSSTGEVLGASFDEAMATNPTGRLVDVEARASRDTGWSFAGGVPVRIGEPRPLMTPEEANKEFKLPGMTPFSRPVSRETAQDIYEEHQRRLARKNAIARRDGGVATGMAARFGTQLLASALDPLNIASAFIPVVPEAKVAAWLAEAGAGTIARAGVRARVGLAEGAVGAAALEPVNYLLDRQTQNDWTMGNAAMNIALGAVMGGVLHTGVGAVRDWRAGPDAVGARVAEIPPEVRETGMRGATAAVVEGRAVDVADGVRASELSAVADRIERRAASVEAMAADVQRVAEVRTMAEGAFGPVLRERQPAPVSLLEFIGSRGGVMEQGGDLRAIGADTHFVPGQGRIVRKEGMALDYAREAAEEAGYLRPNSTIADFLDAVADEVAGRRVYLPQEAVAANERRLARMSDREQERVAAFRSELRALADDHGVRLTDAETDHAVTLTMNGMHPDEAIRAATIGADLRATGFVDEARAEMEAARALAAKGAMEIDMRLAEAARAIDELRTTTGGDATVVGEQIAALERLQQELDAVVDAERAGGRFTPEQERILREFDENAKLAEGDARAMEAAGYCAAVRA